MVSENFLVFLTVTLLTVIVLVATNMYLRIVSRLRRVNEEQDKIIRTSRGEHAMPPAEIRRRIEEGGKHFKKAWDLLDKILS